MSDSENQKKAQGEALTIQPESQSKPESLENATANSGDTYESVTIQSLGDGEERPVTVCTSCPAALWYLTTTDLRCWCSMMRVVLWSKGQPRTLTMCDGREQAIEALEARRMAGPRE